MSDVEQVKLIFRKVVVLQNPDFGSDGDFKFTLTVDGQPVGDPNRVFEAGKGDVINLPQPLWSKVVNVTGKNEFRFTFSGIDEDGFLNGADDDVGTVGRLLRRPFKQEIDAHGETPFYRLVYDVELPVEGVFGRHLPNEIVAAREVPGGLEATTVASTKMLVRAEPHPVVPVPTSPASALPVRPPLPAGVQEDTSNQGAKTITPGSDINILPNPAVIPILSAADNAKPVADQQKLCARIELTYFRPKNLAFTATDSRLKWSFRPTAGGATVDFLGRTEGAKIFVKGLTPGEGVFECRLAREILCTYRALVLPLRALPARFNIIDGINPIKGGPLITPRASPADIVSHLKVANIFLRSLGLELVFDTNTTIMNTSGLTVTATPTTGIFRVRAPIGRTRNASQNSTDFITLVNHRPNVMNFAYIISAGAGNLGAAAHFPNSTIAPPAPGGRPVVTETAAQTPTSSWIKPSGVTPDGAATAQTLQLIRGRLPGPANNRFAMHVTDLCITPATSTPGSNSSCLVYGIVIAHEFCHCLNLGHRVEGTNSAHPTPGIDAPPGTAAAQMNAGGIFFDGQFHPPQENCMHWTIGGTLEHDFDILQARGARRSPLVPQP